MGNHQPVIGIVGPCAAGKTTLIAGLKRHGFEQVRHIAQEHSFVPHMWQRVVNPDILIYLDVSYPLTIRRRQMDWDESEYAEQLYRLRHARQHADLYIQTDALTIEEVLEHTLIYLGKLETA